MASREKIKVGINGLGIIGRYISIILLVLGYNKDVELLAINDASMSIEYMAAVFNSVSSRLQEHRRHDFQVKGENTLFFGERSVAVHAIRNPEEIPWAEMGVEYVIESSGSLTEMDKAAAHLKGGAKKVIITDISKDAPMYVVGLNEKEYKPGYDIVSSASSITNHLAPILEVIYDRFGIVEGHMKIVDSAIATQYSDGPSRMDCVDRRPAFFNPIPIVLTGAKAAAKILQVLNGGFGIGEGLMPTLNTIYAISDAANAVGEFLQTIVHSLGIDDGPLNKLLKLLFSAANKTIDGPCTASSPEIIVSSAPDVQAVGKVLPYLYGKLTGTVSHVPTMDGSIVDLTVRLEVEVTDLEDIQAAIKEESEGKFKGILGYTERDHSRDSVGDSRSSIFYATAGVALNENLFKFIFYCDNPWGYSCRVIDLIAHMDSVQAYSLHAIKHLVELSLSGKLN